MHNCFWNVPVCPLVINVTVHWVVQSRFLGWGPGRKRWSITQVQTGADRWLSVKRFATLNLAASSNDSTTCSSVFPLWLFDEAVDSSVHLQTLYLLFISVQDSGNFSEWPPTSHHLSPPVRRWRCWEIDIQSCGSTCKKRREEKRCRLTTANCTTATAQTSIPPWVRHQRANQSEICHLAGFIILESFTAV